MKRSDLLGLVLCVAVGPAAANATAQACQVAVGGVFETESKEGWIAQTGASNTITFTEFPKFTFITDQFEYLGIIFTGGDDNIIGPNCRGFPNDCWGLDGNSAIDITFTSPHSWLGTDHPGGLTIEAYLAGELVHSSGNFGGGGGGHFAGIVSDVPFDTVVIDDWVDGFPFLDDLHFGAAAPGDVDLDGAVSVTDLVEVILSWGECDPDQTCFADQDHDGVVGLEDILAVILHWR